MHEGTSQFIDLKLLSDIDVGMYCDPTRTTEKAMRMCGYTFAGGRGGVRYEA